MFPVRAKWWSVRVVFSRKLTRREQRRIRLRLDEPSADVGEDGVVFTQFPKWPNDLDVEWLRGALQGLPVDCVERAPYGSTCRGTGCMCEAAPLGSGLACPPTLGEEHRSPLA